MKKYDSMLKAMRGVKQIMKHKDIDEIYVVKHEASPLYVVSIDQSDVEDYLKTEYVRYNNENPDETPDEYIKHLMILCYISQETKNTYTKAYANYKPSLLSKTNYRDKVTAEAEYSVSFTLYE